LSKKPVFLTVLVIVLMGVLGASFDVHKVEAPYPIIYIKADGSIDPPTANITSPDNVTYTFTDDINASIVVEKNNTVVDGAGYTLQGVGGGTGIDLSYTNNVTLQNVKVSNFSYGISLTESSHNTITDSTASNNTFGIFLYGSSYNNTISGNTALNNSDGIFLTFGYNNTITGNTISNNTSNGIQLYSSNHNTIAGNTASNNTFGIFLFDSSYNNITGNVASNNNDDGILLVASSNNTISGNNITGNANSGIRLDSSSDSAISENNISKNNYAGVFLLYSSNITVSGNNVTGNSGKGDGIYLHYSSDNTILKNMDFSDSSIGVLLWGGHRNIISENILSPRDSGIVMGYSDDNRILNNTVSHADVGIEMQQICSNSIIANNMVSENSLYGIYIESENEETRYNAIVGNNIMLSLIGIRITRLSGNVIYHNNFVDNTNQSSISNSTNIWDDGYPSGGNYWSDYTGVDSNRDGIGDSWHEISENNTDNYPLMGMFHSFNTSLGKYVNVISNSTIDSFRYFESNTTIIIHVSNMTSGQTFGFCRIRIPHALMNETYHVTIDGTEPYYVNYTLYDDGENRWIYFNYQHSTLEIVIIPEFPSFLILPLFMMATLMAVIVYRRKHSM